MNDISRSTKPLSLRTVVRGCLVVAVIAGSLAFTLTESMNELLTTEALPDRAPLWLQLAAVLEGSQDSTSASFLGSTSLNLELETTSIEQELFVNAAADARPRAKRWERPNLFPIVTNLYLKGPRYATYTCEGDEAADLNVCCSRRCHQDPQCTAWVRPVSRVSPGTPEGPCELSNTTTYDFDWSEEWHYTEFRNGSKITMDDILPEPSYDVLEKLQNELRNTSCPLPHAVEPQTSRAVKEWLEWAEKQPNGQRKAFLEEGYLIATKVCHYPSLETGEWSAEPALWSVIQTDENAALSPSIEELFRELNFYVPSNGEAYKIIRRPDCSPDVGGGLFGFQRLPMPYKKDMEKVPTFQGIALLADDLWENMGHAGQNLLFLDAVLRTFPEELEVVKTGKSIGRGLIDFVKMMIAAFKGSWPSTSAANAMLAFSGKDQVKKRKPKCYKAAIQRMTQYPAARHFYTYRERLLSHCSIPEPGIPRKIVVHHKNGIRRDFMHKEWAWELLGAWAKNHSLEIVFTDLNGLGACEQVKLFADAAVYIFPHGAGGLHVMSMPAKAVAIEIQPNWWNGGPEARSVSDGYYGGLATGGGVLYTRIRRAIPMGGTVKACCLWGNFPKLLSVDWGNDVLPVLETLWTHWLAHVLAN